MLGAMSEYPGAPDEPRNALAVPTFVIALVAIAISIGGQLVAVPSLAAQGDPQQYSLILGISTIFAGLLALIALILGLVGIGRPGAGRLALGMGIGIAIAVLVAVLTGLLVSGLLSVL
jgi:hypothetical protein